MATTFAPPTDELGVNASLTAAIPENHGFGGTAWTANPSSFGIADTLVLSVFSAIYEFAVVLLRLRSRVSSAASR